MIDYNNNKTNALPILFQDEAQCQNGNLRCLLTNLDDYSRIMDELSYQLDVSETFTYSDEASSDENIEQENFEDFQLEVCHACAQILPVELEDFLQRQGNNMDYS